MGNLIRRDGRLQHEAGNGLLEDVVLTAEGDVLTAVARIEDMRVHQDRRDGRIIIEGGGFAVSVPAAVATSIFKGLSEKIPDAAAFEVDTAIATEARRLEAAATQHRAALDVEFAVRRDELGKLEAEIANTKALKERDGAAADRGI